MTHPLLPFPPGSRVGLLQRRVKRFIIEFSLDGRDCLAHSNNSGSMLGLTRPGNPILVSPALSPERKLPYTLELVGLPGFAPAGTVPVDGFSPAGAGSSDGFSPTETETANGFAPAGTAIPGAVTPTGAGYPDARPPAAAGSGLPAACLWVGVNTLTPNRLLKAAFAAGRLPWAAGYTQYRAEAKRGQSRLDALLTGPGLPPLWVECKNVTLVEDGAAAFPDAVTTRGQKHLREMTDIVRTGERAAFFYCVQRADARCFGPAGYIDPEYGALFVEALRAGVEARPHLALAHAGGIDLGAALPLAQRL